MVLNKTIAVAAGKGGVGKSTVSVLLAQKLKERGFSVGIIDADIYGPSIGHIFHPETQPFVKEGKLQPAICGGIKYISSSFLGYDIKPASVRAPIVNTMVHQFIEEVFWGDLDFLIVDFPPGTGDIQLTLMQILNFDGAILVTTPQKVALHDVEKAFLMFLHMNVRICGMIENLSYLNGKEIEYPFGYGQAIKFCEKNKINYLGRLPIDHSISMCCDNRLNLVKNASSQVLEDFEHITQNFLSGINRPGEESTESFEMIWNKDI